MSEIKNGGPAFPVGDYHQCEFGMSLRDYFAAKAMQSLVPNYRSSNHIASDAYRIADAMLVERENWRSEEDY
jgi:hypothetical protein